MNDCQILSNNAIESRLLGDTRNSFPRDYLPLWMRIVSFYPRAPDSMIRALQMSLRCNQERI